MRRIKESSPEVVAAALNLVRRRTGLVFPQSRRAAFESSLFACLRRSEAGSLEQYLQLLAGSPALFDELAAHLTVGETYFLRDADQWQLIRTQLIPDLLSRHGDQRPVRIWSAGCASGEEPYSAAMVLHQLGATDRGTIVGTDLSRPALARARRGEYPGWALRNVPKEVERTYFRRVGQRFELLPWMRRLVDFRYLNLAEETPPRLTHGLGAMDLILCRNVLIYFDEETVIGVVGRLLDSLAEEGYLMLGASDPMIGDRLPCHVEVTTAGLLYRKAGHRRFPPVCLPAAAPDLATVGGAPDPQPEPFHTGPSTDQAPVLDRVTQARQRYAAKEYAAVADIALGLIREGRADASVEILLVRALANQGELTEAGLACAAALDVHRTSAELIYLHALLLGQAGRHAEAADALRRALYLDRELIVAHLALGDALARTGDVTGAGRAFRAAERLLTQLPPDQPVSASDGEPAAGLAEAARWQLRLLGHSAA